MRAMVTRFQLHASGEARRAWLGAPVALALFAAGGTGPAAQDAGGGPPRHPSPTVVITGANRGLGLEFARQFVAAGANVIGTARRPEEAAELKALGARVEELDVADGKSVARFAARLGALPVDILINNAGVGGRALSLEKLDVDELDRYFQVNCLGAMRVTQALLPAMRQGSRKLIVNITSSLGSLQLNDHGGYYGYRESKAALNMFTRSLAGELEPPGFICVVINPGWVRTDMGGPQAPLLPQESVGGMIKVIDGLKPADTGTFLDYRGERQPW